METYKKISLKLFGWLAQSTQQSFKSLGPVLQKANISMLLKAYISVIFMTFTLVFVVSFTAIFSFGYFFAQSDQEVFLYYLIFSPVMIASFSFVILYIYPTQKAKSIKKSIDSNLPFGLIQMNALASSGIPPETMFSVISGFREYGSFSYEMGLIVRNIKNFGMSSISAIKEVAKRCPSPRLRQIFYGMVSTIEKGGSLDFYLKEMSEKALFDYRVNKEKQSKTLSTLSDIYTAMLITGPLMIITVVIMMNMIGGDFFGLSTGETLFYMTWFAIPGLNLVFLGLLESMNFG